MKERNVDLEEALDSTDWALIIGKDGDLKGLFIPEGEEDDEVPAVIIDICKNHFGIDPTTESDIDNFYEYTLH